MKNTIKLLAIIGLGASLTAVAFAQAAGPTNGSVTIQKPAGQHKHAPNWMETTMKSVLGQLNLTEDQKKSIAALNKQHAADLKAFRKSAAASTGSATPSASGAPAPNPERRAAMREIQKKYRDGLMAILTPAQQQQFKALWKQAMQERKSSSAAAKRQNPPPSK
jgi:Spy/CpxP family protein refolding chaperone